MTSSISKDLFLAILAMDSYNRGYDAGISDSGIDDVDGLGEDADGTITIGSATVVANLETAGIVDEAVATDFYALTYEITDPSQIEGWDNAKTKVLVYRGTDNSTDYQTGWFVGAGDFTRASLRDHP